MSLGLNEIFNMNNIKNSNINQINNNLRNYKKKGTIKENAIDELYNVTIKKLDDKYKDRLSLLMYNGNKVKNYFSKRADLDNIIYNYKDEDKLYITLSNFKKNNNGSTSDNVLKNKNNSSYQNYTENVSNYLTNDTNNNNSSQNQMSEKKVKILARDMYEDFKEEILDREIKKLLLNEEKDLPRNLEKQIFAQLRKKYNFIKEEKKSPKNNLRVYASYKGNPLFKDNNVKFDSVDIIKKKTNELNILKAKKYKSYLSPIFFLGKTNDKFIQNISYASHKKFRKEKEDQNINNIKLENNKYLKIMGKDLNDLHEINKENNNNDIIES